ncbi:MAG: carbohydrate ABC transporter permease, partial [Methanocella sp.]
PPPPPRRGGRPAAAAPPPPALYGGDAMRRSQLKRKEAWVGFLFALPAVSLFAAFAVYPIFRTLYLSFFDYNLLTAPKFKGLGNYVSLFQDPLFWQSVGATAVYIAGTYLPTLVLALGLAMLLNRQLKLRGLFRTLYFTPVVMSMVVVAVIWKLLFYHQGPLNQMLGAFGVPPVAWLSDRRVAPYALAIMTTWKSVGYFMVLYLAGLQGIPREYEEAALIDGASRWQLFRYITLPLLKPITIFVVTMSLLFGMQEFTAQYVMTGGGPDGVTRVLALLTYETAFIFLKMGRATAISIILFAVLLAITLLQRRWLTSTEY